jgi:hypothetical protein
MIFAGFSSILMVLRRRAEGWLPVELLALWLMVGFSLSALLFSFLPILLVQLGVSENAAWRASSAALGLLLLAWLVGVPAAARRMGAGAQAPRATAVGRVVGGLVMLTQLASAFGLGAGRRPGLYLLGVVWLLVSAAGPLVVFVAQQRVSRGGEDS